MKVVGQLSLNIYYYSSIEQKGKNYDLRWSIGNAAELRGDKQ
jgi:hypothetical protein